MLKRIVNIQHTSKIKPALVGLTIALSSSLIGTVAIANLAEISHSVVQPTGATPIIRIEPKYPIAAARNQTEGSVILQFDITKDGSTDNIVVLESFPKATFDKASIKALEKWKYKPRIQGGQAQRQTGLNVQLDFRMDKDKTNKIATTAKADNSVKIEKIKVLN